MIIAQVVTYFVSSLLHFFFCFQCFGDKKVLRCHSVTAKGAAATYAQKRNEK